MIYVNIKEEDFKQYEKSVIKNGVQYYFVHFNEVITDGVVHAVEHEINHIPTSEDIKALQNEWTELNKNWKIVGLQGYAKSSAVKEFTINNINTWFESEQRDSIRYSVACEKKYGRTECIIVFNEHSITMPIDTAEQLLEQLEIYAKDCYVATQNHIDTIKTYENVSDIEQYDYTTGYPEKLVFNI